MIAELMGFQFFTMGSRTDALHEVGYFTFSFEVAESDKMNGSLRMLWLPRKFLARYQFMRAGVDTGGTFSDCVMLAGGKVKIVEGLFHSRRCQRCDRRRGAETGTTGTPPTGSKGIGNREGNGREPSALEVIHGTMVGTKAARAPRRARGTYYHGRL